MTIALVDVDGTVMLERRISRVFWRLASLFQKWGRMTQRPNSELIHKLNEYERVIVLTSRDIKDQRLTKEQLERAGLKFDRIISAERRVVLSKWKSEEAKMVADRGDVTWVDDMFHDSSLKVTCVGTSSRITASDPVEFAGKAGIVSTRLEEL